MECQKFFLLQRLYALGNHVQPQVAGHADDGLHDHIVGGALTQVAHKRLVNLELVQGQVGQVGQRRVARAKVVHRKLHTPGAQLVHFGDGVGHVVQHQ